VGVKLLRIVQERKIAMDRRAAKAPRGNLSKSAVARALLRACGGM
jgi:hypothetical protein